MTNNNHKPRKRPLFSNPSAQLMWDRLQHDWTYHTANAEKAPRDFGHHALATYCNDLMEWCEEKFVGRKLEDKKK